MAPPPGKGGKKGAPVGPSAEELAVEIEVQKALAEKRSAEAAAASAASEATTAAAAAAASAREGELQRASRELAAAQAQDEGERLVAALAAAVAERAKLRAAASAAVAHSAERDRVAQERTLLDAVAAQQAALISKQEAEAATAAATLAALTHELAAATAEADALLLCSRGGGALRVFFGAPWFVTRTFRRLADAPPTRRTASLLPLPAAPVLALVAGAPASPLDGGGVDGASAHLTSVEEADEAAADAYSLSLSSFAWRRAAGLAGAAARVHAAAAATLPSDPADEAAAGGVVLLVGGCVPSDAGAPAPPALLRCAADGALRWAPASQVSVAAAPGGPPPRLGAAAAASPCGRYIYFFGGQGADGTLCADVAAWDGRARAWLPPPPQQQQRAASPSRRSSSSNGGGGGGLNGSGGLPAYNAPRPRRDAALAAAPDGRTLWVYGGAVAGGAVVADAFSYDLLTGAWRARETAVFVGGAVTTAAAAAAASGPGARRCAAATVQGRYLLLAGGVAGGDECGASQLRDAWALDTEAFVWECLLPATPDANAGDAAAAPGAVAMCAWRGATLCVLRGGAHGKFDLLETAHFMLPDDLDALMASRGARARARFSAGAMRADREGDTSSFAEAAADVASVDLPGDALRLWTLAARGSTWLDVAWRPPARRAERVTGYRLMVAPAGATSVRTSYAGPATHARVGGLRPGTEYVCVVKAQYADGSHEWSDTESFTTAPAANAAPPRRSSLTGGGGFSAHLRGSRRAAPPLSAAAAAAVEAAEAAGGDVFPVDKPPPTPPREHHAPPPLQLPGEGVPYDGDEGGPTPTSAVGGTPPYDAAAVGGGITPPPTPLAPASGALTPRSPRLSSTPGRPPSAAAAEAAAAWDAGEADASFAVVAPPGEEAVEEAQAQAAQVE